MTLPAKPAAVILAAGESRRMGFPKPLLELNGETFLDRLIAAIAPYCSPVNVVLGYHAARVTAGTRRAAEVAWIHNPAPERGMLSSLQAGIASLPPECPGVVFTPVDYPRVRPSTVLALTEAFARTAAPVALPVHNGERGHPVLISRVLIPELLALPSGGQARQVIRRYREQTVTVEVDDPGILLDVDEPEDYRRLNESLS